MHFTLRLIHRGLILVCVPLLFELGLVLVLLNQTYQLEREIDRERHNRILLDKLTETARQYFKAGSDIGRLNTFNYNTESPEFEETARQFFEDLKILPTLRKSLESMASDEPSFQQSVKHCVSILSEVENKNLFPCKELALQRLILANQERNQFKEELDLIFFDEMVAHMHEMTTFGNTLSSVLTPIRQSFKEVQTESPRIQKKLREQQKIILIVFLVASIILALQLAFFFITGIVKRLLTITDNTTRLKEERALNPLLKGNDEIALLDNFFHDMAGTLKESRDKEREMLDRMMMAEARVRSVIENMPVGVVILGTDGRVQTINPQVEQLFRYEADELIGGRIDPLFTARSARDTVVLKRLLSLEKGKKTEFFATKKNGDNFFAELVLTEFETFEGLRYLLSIQDVTDRHEIERIKQEFYAMIAHDLRTPLMSAYMAVSMVTDGILGEVPPKIKETLVRAETGIKRLTGLINDFLDFEKLQSGKFELDYKLMSVESLIQRSVTEVEALANKYGLRIEIPDFDAMTFADEDRLVQVLVNLLSNAIKFSPENATIRTGADLSEDKITISITDEGPGIPGELQEKLFESFSQVQSNQSKAKIKGTGLGLAISKMIVEEHGGKIGVTSELGKGSTFWLQIPMKNKI